jgi:hypothetical protein
MQIRDTFRWLVCDQDLKYKFDYTRAGKAESAGGKLIIQDSTLNLVLIAP